MNNKNINKLKKIKWPLATQNKQQATLIIS